MSNRILIIDDSREICENAAELLELAGYQVSTAENGKAGFEKIREEKPDLVLCDIMMPELDGYGVLRAINNQPELLSIPFVFLTAKIEKSDFRKAMDLGADDYLTKPFDGDELLRVVEARLKKSHRNGQVRLQYLEGIRGEQSLDKLMEEVAQLAMNKPIKKVEAKDAIFMEGDTVNYLYYIVSGKVKSYKTNEWGKELITAIFSEGEFFGHLRLLDNLVARQSVMAIEDTELALITKKEFFDFLYTSKDGAIKFMRFVSGNCEEAEDRLLKLAYDSARRRVAEALLLVAGKSGKEEGKDGVSFQAFRENISAIAGISPESVSRNLTDFKEEGLIETGKGEIRILSREKLQNIKG